MHRLGLNYIAIGCLLLWLRRATVFVTLQSIALEMLNKGPAVNRERLAYLNERRHCISERLDAVLSRASQACEVAAQAAKDVKYMGKNLPLYAVHVQRTLAGEQLPSRRRTSSD